MRVCSSHSKNSTPRRLAKRPQATDGSYVGSGTERTIGGKSRLKGYAGWLRSGNWPKAQLNRHGRMLQAGGQPNFRVVWTAPKDKMSPLLAIVVEGLLMTYLRSVTDDIGNAPFRMATDAMRGFTRENGAANIDPASIVPLNGVNALAQGCAYKSRSSTCAGCDEAIGKKQRTRVSFDRDGLTRYHIPCYPRKFRQTLAQWPKSCSSCRSQGFAHTCNGKSPCNYCSAPGNIKRRLRCVYGEEVKHYWQNPDDRCERCKKEKRNCTGENGGPTCDACAKGRYICTFAPHERKPVQDISDKCERCRGRAAGAHSKTTVRNAMLV